MEKLPQESIFFLKVLRLRLAMKTFDKCSCGFSSFVREKKKEKNVFHNRIKSAQCNSVKFDYVVRSLNARRENTKSIIRKV